MPKILPNLHEEILMAGRDLLGESGYEEFSMRAVAARCGIGVGTLYNYYPSKQHLVAGILRSEWDIHLRRMAQAAKQDKPELERLEAVFSELVAFMGGKHSVFVAQMPDKIDFDEVRGALARRAAVRQQIIDVVGSILCERPDGERELLSDAIARLFLSYSADGGQRPAAIRSILTKLLV